MEDDTERQGGSPNYWLVPGVGTGYAVAPHIMANGETKLLQIITDSNLNTTAPKVRIVGTTKDDDGTDGATNSTVERYESIWKGFRSFCFLVGDYGSAMLPSRDVCPANPFPVDRLTAEMYLDFRCKKQMPLRHPTTHEPVLDVDKVPIITIGDWGGESSVGLFRSAISKLHKHYETTKGEYAEPCNECKKIPIERICSGEGCRDHPGRPHYWRRGNPMLDAKFSEKVKKTETYVVNNNIARHTFAFLPGQLRSIRDFLLSTNDLFNLMLWTIIITGVKLFQRIDEVIVMEVDHFKTEYFVVKVDSVEGLVVEINGKREKTPLQFAMWHDKECPEFSAPVAILIWIAASGIQSGPLFPTKDELKTRKPSYTTQISYSTCLTCIKNLCTGVLKLKIVGRDDPRIFGTHILRKTAFLFAYWGIVSSTGNETVSKFDEAAILLSARHSDISSTATYLGDSSTLKALLDRISPNDPRHHVGKWESIHISTLDTFASINIESSKYTKALPELANWYVFTILNVNPSDSQVSFMHIHRLACAYTPNLTYEEKVKDILSKKLSPNELAEVLNLVNLGTNERVRAAMHTLAPAPTGNDSNSSKIVVQPFPIDIPNKKRKQNMENSVVCERDYQSEVKKNPSKAAKVKICVDCNDEVKQQISQGKILVDPLRSFSYRAAKVAQCVKECHGGSIDSFVAANPRFAVSKFGTCSNNKKHTGSFDS